MSAIPTRPLLAALLIVGILGGMAIYTSFLERLRAQARADAGLREGIHEVAATGQYSLEVTLTFDAAPDEFSAFPNPASVLVQRSAVPPVDLLRITKPVAAGTPIRVENVQGLVLGENRLIVSAFPADIASTRELALRLRVFQGTQVIGETSVWSSLGQLDSTELIVDLKEATPGHTH